MIAHGIYTLCGLASLFCFGVLLRGYMRHRTRILLSSSAAFLAFAIANVLLVIDLVFLPKVDLSVLRNGLTLAGVVLLASALIGQS